MLILLSAMQAAEELGCSLFVHPWDMQTDGRMDKYWLPWLIGEEDVVESDRFGYINKYQLCLLVPKANDQFCLLMPC